jgi:hypothetical protein
MDYRLYDPKKDKDTVYRIWLETGWLKKDHPEPLDLLLKSERALIAEQHGEAECLVLTTPGDLRYLDNILTFRVVAAVTTSQVARRQGLARRLTAQAVALDAANGAALAGLGMFEQGFYNHLGFGSFAYEHRVRFDPARLNVEAKARPPYRLTEADAARVHTNRLHRRRRHGSVSIYDVNYTKADISFAQTYFARGFGLGYQDETSGEFTHHLWGAMEEAEFGPLNILWMAYQTQEQLLELLALVKIQSDQVTWVNMVEPPGLQMQDLIEQPIRQRRVSERSKFPSGIRTQSNCQMRICDLNACLRQTHLPAGEVRFNLELSDPIEDFLDPDAPWQGISGSYVIILGAASSAERGRDERLPTLHASVGAFTRMWLGVRPASGLVVSDNLAGPPDLLDALDGLLCLPVPMVDWPF